MRYATRDKIRRDLRVSTNIVAHAKKGSLDVILIQHLQHVVCQVGDRAVVKGEIKLLFESGDGPGQVVGEQW